MLRIIPNCSQMPSLCIMCMICLVSAPSQNKDLKRECPEKTMAQVAIHHYKIGILLKGHFTINKNTSSISKAGSCYFVSTMFLSPGCVICTCWRHTRPSPHSYIPLEVFGGSGRSNIFVTNWAPPVVFVTKWVPPPLVFVINWTYPTCICDELSLPHSYLCRIRVQWCRAPTGNCDQIGGPCAHSRAITYC